MKKNTKTCSISLRLCAACLLKMIHTPGLFFITTSSHLVLRAEAAGVTAPAESATSGKGTMLRSLFPSWRSTSSEDDPGPSARQKRRLATSCGLCSRRNIKARVSPRGKVDQTPPDKPLLAIASFLAGDPTEQEPGNHPRPRPFWPCRFWPETPGRAEASTPLRAVSRSWLGAADQARAAASGSRSKEEDLERRRRGRDARLARNMVKGLLQAIKDDTVKPHSIAEDSFAHDWNDVACTLAARKRRADAFDNINTPEPAGNGIRNNIHARQSFFQEIFEAFVAENVDPHGGPAQRIPTELLVSLEDAIGRICTAPDVGVDKSSSTLTYYRLRDVPDTEVKTRVSALAPPRERESVVSISVVQGDDDPPLEINTYKM
ncbi:unnamed protein product [Amoebophrya sp. A120]|nr:unnamed protein product [Amoebophrya sp. A120]|eukprot:GSA120T00007118001.1